MRRGFTLIELLVTLAIMVLVFGLSAVGYRTFARRQAVLSAGKEFLGAARSIQAKAKSGVKNASGCATTPLRGYELGVSASDLHTYTISEVYEQPCARGGTSDRFTVKSVTLAQSVVFSESFSVLFFGLSGGALLSGSSPQLIHLCLSECISGQAAFGISLTDTGLISDSGMTTL